MDQPDSSGDNCSIYHNIVDKVGDHFYQRLHSIEELCDSMDLPHTTRDHRMNRMFKSITNFIERLHQNELNQLMGEFTVRRNQVNIMLRSLSLDPYIPDRAKSFLSQSKELTAKYYELIRTRNNRLKQMKDMCEELASVQMLLGEAYVKPNSEKDIPSKVELDQLRSVLKRKRNQLTTVQTHCDHLRRQMIKIQADIDFEANFQEEELLTSSTIIYKHSVVKRIENLYQKLCTLQSEAEIELEMLKRKFVQLCYLLEIDDQLFTTFTDSLKGSINEKQDFYRKRISAFVELRQTKQVNLFRNEFKSLLGLGFNESNECFTQSLTSFNRRRTLKPSDFSDFSFET